MSLRTGKIFHGGIDDRGLDRRWRETGAEGEDAADSDAKAAGKQAQP